jgi:putative tricarboxylic transport membrane protein
LTMTTIAGIAAVLLGAVYTSIAYHLPRATVGNPVGPIVFPLIVGYGMIALGALMVIQDQLRLRRAAGQRAQGTGGAGSQAAVQPRMTVYGRNIAIVAAVCVAYALLFERLGYVLSTFLFLESILLLFNGWKKWKMTLIVSLGFSIGVYILFSNFLGIPLPRMILLDI